MAINGEKSAVSHQWKPIELIEQEAEEYDFQEIDSLQRQWLEVKKNVEISTPEAYRKFTERLTRRWAIETGIIEGVYDLDRGVTETLVAKGIAADYIERGSTDKEPSDLVDILRDHQDSVEAVNYWIREGHPLTKWFIKSLHSQILKNQSSVRPDEKGAFKKTRNQAARPDATNHEYCPPEQVESELDRLLELYNKYDSADCHPLLLAAWLHHRFEQIHPFQDGNGRVGRAVLTWHLVRKGFFPIVVSRDDRTKYIDALENADAGDLTHLIGLFVGLEKSTILQAISEGETETQIAVEPQIDLVSQVVSGIVDRANRRRQSEAAQMRSVNDTAQTLRGEASGRLVDISRSIAKEFEQAGIYVSPLITEGGPDKYNEYWYWRQIIETAEKFRHWVNPNEPRYFVRLTLNPERGRTPRLIFVISLHNTGRQLTGIMSATAFAEIEYHDGDASNDPLQSSRISGNVDFRDCAVNPFTFTWDDSVDDIRDRFVKWMEGCFAIALRYWGEYLT